MPIILGLGALLLLAVILMVAAVYYVGLGIALLVQHLRERLRQHRRQRTAQIEAELDLTEQELRLTIFQLADALSASAHDAQRALVRESFLHSGQLPPPPK